jgi:hypothetical protein
MPRSGYTQFHGGARLIANAANFNPEIALFGALGCHQVALPVQYVTANNNQIESNTTSARCTRIQQQISIVK